MAGREKKIAGKLGSGSWGQHLKWNESEFFRVKPITVQQGSSMVLDPGLSR